MNWEELFEAVEFETVSEFVRVWDAETAEWFDVRWETSVEEPEWPAE